MADFSLKNLFSAFSKIRTVGIFLSVVVVFIILAQFAFFKPVTQGVQFVFSTIGQGLGDMYSRVTTSPDSVRAQLDQANARAAALSVSESRLSTLQRDVEELERLLDYTQTIETNYTASRVLARSVGSDHVILIDKGSQDGVKEGLAVTVEDGHLIGVITHVDSYSSTVMLLSDPASRIPATILDVDSTIGLVEGEGGYLYKMGFIPHDRDIENEQVVVTSGLEGMIPKGLIVGSVAEVHRVDTELFVEADIEPFVYAKDYQWVLIVNPLAGTVYGS